MMKSRTNAEQSSSRARKSRKRSAPQNSGSARTTKTASLLALLSKGLGQDYGPCSRTIRYEASLRVHVRNKLGLQLSS